MKVSGSEQVSITAMTQTGFRLEEDKAIMNTSTRLAQEGKTVINIIHGTPQSAVGSMHKTLTFLWESDDTDPRYMAYAEDERRKSQWAERTAQYKKEIAELETRIKNAQTGVKNPRSREEVARENTTAGIGAIIFGIAMGWFAIELIGGIGSVVFCLIAGFFILCGFLMLTSNADEDAKEEQEIYRLIESDKNRLPELENELLQKKREYMDFLMTYL